MTGKREAFDDSNLLILMIAFGVVLTQQSHERMMLSEGFSRDNILFVAGVHYWRLPWTVSSGYKLVEILLAGREQ